MTTTNESEPRRPAHAHDLHGGHLVLSQFSMARTAPFADRVAAAAGAGFDGVGVSAREAMVLDPAAVVDVLAANDIVCSELEGWFGWGQRGEALDASLAMAAAAFAVADATGARHIQAWGSYEGDLDDAIAAFGVACDRAADHGLLVALEFLPFTNVPDAATALAIVEGADRPNGGLCVDVWHHERGAHDIEQLRAIPRERVVAVQLDDGPRVPVLDDYYEDCLRHRLAPGDGEFDLVGFLQVLREIGADAPLAVEVLSDTAQTRAPDAVARELMTATRTVRDAAWTSPG